MHSKYVNPPPDPSSKEYWEKEFWNLIYKRGTYVNFMRDYNNDLLGRIRFMQKIIDAQRDTILSWTKARDHE